MSEKFEVSFNSPQCGWMSVGFKNKENEFHSTTAHTPHKGVLSELLQTLTKLLGDENFEKTLLWNRNPEEFDFYFAKLNDEVRFEIYQYPTEERLEKELCFVHIGFIQDFCESFFLTFTQLYEDRETDEFEANWKQPFPFEDFKKFSQTLNIL